MAVRWRKPSKNLLRAVRSGPIPRMRDWRTLADQFETSEEMHKKLTRAEINMYWIESVLIVPEGNLVGQPFHLEEFQELFLYQLWDGVDVSMAILSIARRNGKTGLIAAIIMVYLCGPEARLNNQLASAARSREQAALCFDLARKMIMMSEELSAMVHVVPSKKELIGLKHNTDYRALAAEASKALGRSPVLCIHDELGQVKGPTDPFYESLETAQGSHDNPLSIVISTQAPSDSALLSTLIDDCTINEQPNVVCHLYAADKDDDGNIDIMNEDNWRKSNPALGIFRSEKDLRRQMEKAERMPGTAPGALNLLLNARVAATGLYVSPTVWKENGEEPELHWFQDGRKVSLGLDLSARVDLCAACLACRDDDGFVHVIPFTYCPTIGIEERELKDRAPYRHWINEGHLTPIGGASMDYDQIFTHLQDTISEMDIEVTTVEADAWRLDVFKSVMEKTGAFSYAEINPVRQGFQTMSPILECMTSLLLAKKVRHGSHPLLNMAAANTAVIMDAAKNQKIIKGENNNGRIDPMIALVQAVFAVSEGDQEEGFDADALVG